MNARRRDPKVTAGSFNFFHLCSLGEKVERGEGRCQPQIRGTALGAAPRGLPATAGGIPDRRRIWADAAQDMAATERCAGGAASYPMRTTRAAGPRRNPLTAARGGRCLLPASNKAGRVQRTGGDNFTRTGHARPHKNFVKEADWTVVRQADERIRARVRARARAPVRDSLPKKIEGGGGRW